MMQTTDIITIEFDQGDIDEAKRDQQFLHENRSQNTRALRSDRDIIGSLGHLAVECALTNWDQPFYSTRLERYKSGGDTVDIVYQNDQIDVKATRQRGPFPGKWFYNQGFLVIQDQLDDPKIEATTHFCFVTVEEDYSAAHIFGIISRPQFLSIAQPVRLEYDNQQVKAKDLVPLRKYIFRV